MDKAKGRPKGSRTLSRKAIEAFVEVVRELEKSQPWNIEAACRAVARGPRAQSDKSLKQNYYRVRDWFGIWRLAEVDQPGAIRSVVRVLEAQYRDAANLYDRALRECADELNRQMIEEDEAGVTDDDTPEAAKRKMNTFRAAMRRRNG